MADFMTWPERLEAASHEMRQHEPISLGRPATEDEIASAELTLNVAFSNSYKWLLNTFGMAVWPEYIYGLGSKAMNVVDMTEHERENTEIGLPSPFVAVSPDGWGNHYCLDTGRLLNGECPIVFWNHQEGPDQALITTHATFLDWLEDTIRESKEWENEGIDAASRE